ncbi:aspartate kinase [Proteinivorax hydrogeniformans]|uniref:Aspartokinase n=1 Tax=Proteinivorax hydrogeniformans TaxID=1826727 RepID=A0AAU8HNV2_9FIRM
MIKVQKFGGTSVATEQQRRNIAQNAVVQIQKNNNLKLVLVVSAMGREGSPYATDTLLNLLKKHSETSKSKIDLLLSCGEIISAVLLASEVESHNVQCSILTGWNMGIKTDTKFTNANILEVNDTNFKKAFKEHSIIVIPGFQGLTNTNEISTLGRGGSDITAVAVGDALKAESVEIFTDVKGVMTADPKIVPSAHKLKEITYEEIFQMANGGAKVIHPRAVEMAMKANLNLWIKSTDFKDQGTSIKKVHSLLHDNKTTNKIITGIADIKGLLQYSVYFDKEDKRLELELFKRIADNDVSLDLINLTPKLKVFTVPQKDRQEVDKVLNYHNLSYEVVKDCTKITIIGAAMEGKPGVMSKILEPLFESKIPILQTADSHVNISILVKSVYAKSAINALHKSLIEKRW